jgi:hypothetical protein
MPTVKPLFFSLRFAIARTADNQRLRSMSSDREARRSRFGAWLARNVKMEILFQLLTHEKFLTNMHAGAQQQ